MLYLIGLGLNDEKDITIKGLEAIKKCKEIYLENYTSKLQVSKEDLEKFYKKKIIEANRNLIENNFGEIIKKSKKINIALLIIGDVFSATTHISIYNRCKEFNCKVEVINNSSILNAVGITGLELYKFGKITSIPFDLNVTTPIEVINFNLKNDLHSLILLDLDIEKNRFLTIKESCEYLIKNNIKEKIIACARLGIKNFIIKYGSLERIKDINFGKPPYCLIIPSKNLHFVEEESLNGISNKNNC